MIKSDIPTKNSYDYDKVLDEKVQDYFNENAWGIVETILLFYEGGKSNVVLSFPSDLAEDNTVFLQHLANLIWKCFYEAGGGWNFTTKVLPNEGKIQIIF